MQNSLKIFSAEMEQHKKLNVVETYEQLAWECLKPTSQMWSFASEDAKRSEIQQVISRRRNILQWFVENLERTGLIKMREKSRMSTRYLKAPAWVRKIKSDEMFKMMFSAWNRPFSGAMKLPTMFMQDFGQFVLKENNVEGKEFYE